MKKEHKKSNNKYKKLKKFSRAKVTLRIFLKSTRINHAKSLKVSLQKYKVAAVRNYKLIIMKSFYKTTL